MEKTKENRRGIDGEWFKQRLAERNKSVRGLARHLEIDVSAASRMLSGQRRMKMEEASKIASFLGAPVNEVLAHAGVSIDIEGQPTQVLLAATIDSDGEVKRLLSPKPLPQNLIERAQAAITVHGSDTMIGAQVRADGGPLAMFDDAVVLFKPTETVEVTAIGTLAICRLRDGRQIVAKIERCRKTGEARILNARSEATEVMLDTATPVLVVIP